jgi:cyclomaltodextrin glucanotransferase
MLEVFEQPDGDYAALAAALHLVDGPYQNPYELTTFYDNHDMARMNASDNGFIDAHHWLFTARGIPVIYYGSEAGFMRGRAEHAGNRNYFGTEGVEAAREHPIRQKLARIAAIRAASPALQRGLQLNLTFGGNGASFYRVLQHEGITQTALVVLNKGDTPLVLEPGNDLQPGRWRNAFDGALWEVLDPAGQRIEVAPHDVAVWLLDAPITLPELTARLDALMAGRERRRTDG